MNLIEIELTKLIKNKKIKRISCLIDEYSKQELIQKISDKEFEFNTGKFVIEMEDGSLISFSNSEWGFATYYNNLEELKKEELK